MAAFYPIFGDAHTTELKFVFDNPFPPPFPFSEKDKEMAKQFGTYWSSMAKEHDPNGNGGG